MIQILEILLYLQLLSPTGNYTSDDINAIINNNQPVIQNMENNLQNNPNLQTQIDQQWGTTAAGIEKIDIDEEN